MTKYIILFVIFPLAFTCIFSQNLCEIEPDITGDFPVGERIDPKIFTLNGKDARDHMFSPGQYTLEIAQPGYVHLKEQIIIPENQNPFLIERVLVTKQREVSVNIGYDVAPQKNSSPYEISCQLHGVDKAIRVVKGLLLKPNSYLFTIKKQGYHTAQMKKHIWPDDRPFMIDETLISRPVPLTFDIEGSAPNHLHVMIRDTTRNIPLVVKDGDKVKPGKYHLMISQKNCRQISRDIHIFPTDNNFIIKEKLEPAENAGSAQLSLICKDENNNVQVPYEVQVNGQLLQQQKFSEGQKLDIVVKFKYYATHKRTVLFSPGSSIKIPLLKLTKYEFSFRKKHQMIDGVIYPYTFYADGKEVENHHVLIEKGSNRYYFTLWINPRTNILDMEAGYFHTKRYLKRFRAGQNLSRPDKIVSSKMVDHLQKIQTTNDSNASLRTLEKILKSYRSRKLLRGQNIEPLIQYVEGMKKKNAQQHQRARNITDSLRNLKTRHAQNVNAGFVPQVKKEVPKPKFNTEQYSYIVENEFKNALDNPLSTVSADVDTASYSNIRRYINMGKLPPKDAVRIEECINYFHYDYPQPKEHPFSVSTELSSVPWDQEKLLLHVGLQGKTMQNVPAYNLVFLIDVSGSMSDANKLPLLKASLKLLAKKIRKQDRVSIVVYASENKVVLPPTNNHNKIIAALNGLQAYGSTNGGNGIHAAYQLATQSFMKDGTNRVILATDGDFNVGTTSNAALVRLIQEKRKTGVFLSVLGFGYGNYKDAKMEQLADNGNGNCAYIDNLTEGRKVLVEEFAAMTTIAKDVKIQIEFNPKNVQSYRLIGYENRKMPKEHFANDKKDAGEIGAGHSVTVLYEIIPVKSDSNEQQTKLKYQKTSLSHVANNELMTLKLRYKKPDGDKSILREFPVAFRKLSPKETSQNFRWATAVSAWTHILRDSKFKGDVTYDHVIELIQQARGEDQDGYRSEFLRLVKLARALGK
ncbi:vWA domain-containing protein [Candidatus Uabimicrobium amorphum]|uniref:VWFA domain-containing protein n=1 Tax=Uabimicrobium amorphum TaxID=2596890 RepID=A0A5S9IIB0_UABAM|nr:VWA domain-containing protein [Candidatus Uabimicrobium amorphum]BBM82097.1 hypothetical protein UABAM_00440 [Candidatus Uabimicrobium amorphum]